MEPSISLNRKVTVPVGSSLTLHTVVWAQTVALVRWEPVAGGYAATFVLDAATTVEDPPRREAACCGFLDIQTHRTDLVRLLVRCDDPEALPVVELLVGPGSP